MRRRILVSMVAVTALAVLAFAVPLAIAAGRLYRGREVGRLERAATRTAGAVPPDGLHRDRPIQLAQDGSIRVAVYDTTGRRAAGIGPSSGGSEVRAALRGQVANDHDGGWLAVAVPIYDEQHVIGVARAQLRWDVIADDTVRSWLLLVGLGTVAVAVAAGLAWRQSSRLVAPIDGLTGLAVQLGDGDFTARVQPSGVEEIDRAGAALNRTADRLGALLGRERAFSADVSHQLNTPLTSLRLSIESALLAPGGDDRTSLEEALTEVDRLQATVSTLLAVARDRGPVPVPVDVASVCADVAQRRRASLTSEGRALRVEIEPELPAALFSTDALREILAVLLDNATGHGKGTVSLVARRAGRGVVVEVADDGPGVLSAERVFERRATDAAGHGIGLSLARSVAEAHGGRLLLTRSGPHPTFTVALPGTAPPIG